MINVPTAKDIMTVDTLTVEANDRVIDVAQRLIGKGVSTAPVVERGLGHEIVIGFISEKDVMQCFASGSFHANPDMTASEIMRPHPVCVGPEADVFTLAAIFMQHSYRHLPVVVGQALQGMVSRRDVLRGLMEHYETWKTLAPQDRKVPSLAGVFTPRYTLS